ncbi:hypothetical protein R1sor_018361 [Riccia sorocarpa]|uniref:Potassium channel domain-containing protein n=1 Tax=Riccia sorocarpa TaxID=122646 RepID=A0ABD3IFQ0_9MARC
METPLLAEEPSGVSTNYCCDSHEGANPILRHSCSLEKWQHPTLSLLSPRAKSSSSPLNSPRKQPESYLSFFLNGQGRRTEPFYVPPYGASYYQQDYRSPLVPKHEAPSDSHITSGSSLTSLSKIPENFTTTETPQVDSVSGPSKDLEAAIPEEEEQKDHDCTETCESCGNGLVNGESGLHRYEDPQAQYSSSPEEEEKMHIVEEPKSGGSNNRNVKRRRQHLHKCRTEPRLSIVAGARLLKAHTDTDGKKKVNAVSATGVVWQAFLGLLIYLFVGVMIYCWKKDEFRGVETVGWIDALYFCIVTMCTIGYGDITPETPAAKMLSCALVLVGFGFIDALMGGMVTVLLDRQENMLLNVVLHGHEVAKGYVLNAEKGTMRIRLKVFLAVSTVLGSVAVGAFFLHFVEKLQWIDSFYVTIISITTVGYGDYSFQTKWGRLLAALWLLFCTLGVARAFLFLAEARVQKRERHFAKKMLQSKMLAADMADADIDNDGHVSLSEYVVYKLKAMRKISEKDIVAIVKQFDQLDSAGVGRISMVQLLEAEAEAANESSRT